MKLKYKKLVIFITAATMVLSFIILTLIPTGGSNTNNAEDANLALNENEEINQLVKNYFESKKTVDIETMSQYVSDPNRINKEKFSKMAEYVEGYQNINCYVIESEDTDAYRVYAKYDMKLKNIDTLAPCLSAFYITATSDDKYVIYLSALDEAQEEFITSADKNSEIVDLKEKVAGELQAAIDKDVAFKQFYQKMDQEIKAASASGAAANAGQPLP